MKKDILARALDEFATPLYLFDESAFVRTVAHVRSMLPGRVSLCYAMKANPFALRWAGSEVDRIEVCSTGEARICQQVGIPMRKVVASGVHKDLSLMHELMAGYEFVCRYTVESPSQFEMIRDMARILGVRVPILVRLTSGNQFGVDAVQARDLIRRAYESDSVYPCGIQYFSGTQKSSGKRIARELERLDTFLAGAEREFGIKLEELEYGAGLAIEYFADDGAAREKEEMQLRSLGDALGHMRFEGRLVVELGRALVASCGTYVTSVMDTKRNGGFNYAIVDGGMHQITYFGHSMSLRQPPLRVIGKHQRSTDEVWTLCGSLCTTNDVLAKQIPCAKLCVGDVVAFERAGAYGMTEGLSLFLSRDLPRVILADRQGNLVQARDRIETWTFNTNMKGSQK